MASLKQLKEKRKSVNKTRKVTRAMEAVSAVKMRKAQERALGARGYARAAMRILAQVASASKLTEHPLTVKRDGGKVGLIVITSDKGLAGSLNSAVLKKATDFLKEKSLTNKDVLCITLGRRGGDYFRKRGFEMLHSEENKSDEVEKTDLESITELALEKHLSKETRSWYIVYTNFKSTFEQEAKLTRLFPLSRGALEEIIASIAPEKGKYAEGAADKALKAGGAYTVEAETDGDVMQFLAPMLGNILVYHTLLESKASEHSARMVAMKSATDKAGELSHILQLKFNKARQAAITREVSEITSGIEAMK